MILPQITNLTISHPITSTATTPPIGGKRVKLKGYRFELYHTEHCIHEQQVYNQASRADNSCILTIKRANVSVYGYVCDYTESLSMDVRSIINTYFGNNYLDIDIPHPILMIWKNMESGGDGYSSKIRFSIASLGESKCKMDSYCVGVWCRGFSNDVLKSKNGDGNAEYYAINDFFESKDDYDCDC